MKKLLLVMVVACLASFVQIYANESKSSNSSKKKSEKVKEEKGKIKKSAKTVLFAKGIPPIALPDPDEDENGE